jgi:hypothetical protein
MFTDQSEVLARQQALHGQLSFDSQNNHQPFAGSETTISGHLPAFIRLHFRTGFPSFKFRS